MHGYLVGWNINSQYENNFYIERTNTHAGTGVVVGGSVEDINMMIFNKDKKLWRTGGQAHKDTYHCSLIENVTTTRTGVHSLQSKLESDRIVLEIVAPIIRFGREFQNVVILRKIPVL